MITIWINIKLEIHLYRQKSRYFLKHFQNKNQLFFVKIKNGLLKITTGFILIFNLRKNNNLQYSEGVMQLIIPNYN